MKTAKTDALKKKREEDTECKQCGSKKHGSKDCKYKVFKKEEHG